MMLQRSDAWHEARLGRVTASRVADVIAKTKTGWGASRANYAAELLAERLTGTVAEGYVSPAMQHGLDTEAQARAAYEFYVDAAVEEVGFVPHPTLFAGASPDGLVGADGLVEIKAPNTATHIDTLLGAAIADKYQVQMLWQMACCGRDWCDFVSFDPRLPPRMQFHVRRFHRDDERLRFLESDVAEFLAELDEKEARLRAKFADAPYVTPLRAQLTASLNTDNLLMAG